MEQVALFFTFLNQHQPLVDALLLFTGLTIGKFKEFATLYRLMTLVIRALMWWFKHHPVGRRQALQTKDDEKLYQLAQELEPSLSGAGSISL